MQDIEKTKAIAAALANLQEDEVDWQQFSLALLSIKGLAELGEILEDHSQRWEAIAGALCRSLYIEDPHFIRICKILNAMSESRNYALISQLSGYKDMPVRHTVHLMTKGGIRLDEDFHATADTGRPQKFLQVPETFLNRLNFLCLPESG